MIILFVILCCLQNILGEFSREQEAFIRGQQGGGEGLAPWVGHQNEEKVKEEIIGLSSVCVHVQCQNKNKLIKPLN